MTQYRFVTPHRTGKWYPDLLTAQQQAFAIGAGFYDQRSCLFYPYKDTRLEIDDTLVNGPHEGIAA
ncbi:MAG: hypothetical protein B7X90_03285 [Novosphingobium sp. 17-62-19]|uniref:hypothetical protein n=1 Tax=Novosphingobium sp. 17-62-19 TaxID=1970406 RepID=UPI000BCB3C04|nr:hypothetical protein [Novosphingobium sp. 17-62-19]OYX93525.1 MAG: hypothetical protein B7Y74_09440 [Novosphingobium sp. 35-62-5]OZA21142.1 MAG: hypothetical protein B7X90_03285 [Novosphingobium sp. 17-62-19]HQS95290.1 hypothetical protein [Novosphingobium sp.]